MWDLEVRVLRKVDSSVGAALNGEGIGDIDDATDVGALAGGLPKLFFGFGMVITPCRCASSGATTSLRIIRAPKTPIPKKIRERQTRLSTTKQTNQTHAPQQMDDRKPNGGLPGLIARTTVSLPLLLFPRERKSKQPTNEPTRSRKRPSSPSTPLSPSPPNEPTSAPSSSP